MEFATYNLNTIGTVKTLGHSNRNACAWMSQEENKLKEMDQEEFAVQKA